MLEGAMRHHYERMGWRWDGGRRHFDAVARLQLESAEGVDKGKGKGKFIVAPERILRRSGRSSSR